ncbi:hypothetical protein AGMMS49992_24920 [Clostridia bacterium]|nr:hypothetical protein AGMMS49992_24920 [Clostridia bacterium]
MKKQPHRILTMLLIVCVIIVGMIPLGLAETTGGGYPGKNTDKVLRIAGESPSVVQFDGNPSSNYGSGGMMGSFLYEGMFSYTRSTDGLRNRLASEMTHDGNKTTVKLRDDVYYNDGTKFTAKDIWCCLMIDYAQRINQWISDVQIIDDYTLEFMWVEPLLIDEIRDIYMAQNQHAKMPYHIYGQFADKAAELLAQCETIENAPGVTSPFSKGIPSEIGEQLDANWDAYIAFSPPDKQPVGTGPYMLDRMTDNEVIMKRNPYFYEPDAYGFDNLVFKKVTPEQAVAMIKNGELDYYESALPVDMMTAILESNPDIVYYPAYDPAGNGFMFDQTSDTAPMADKAFRQAIVYAIDKEPLRQAGCYYGTTAEGISSVGIPYNTIDKWVSPEVVSQMRNYTYSPETAAQILTDAGYEKVDGWWRNKDGSIIKIELVAPADWQPAGVTNVVSSMVQNQLIEFGLMVEVKLLPLAVYWEQCDQNMYDMVWDYVDVTWLNLYPNGALDSHFVRSRLPKGWPRTADDGRKLNLQLEDFNGETFDVLESINFLATERDTEKAQKLIDQLVWGANEYAFSVEFYQLITGAFWNRAFVEGFAREDEIDAFNQLMPLNTTDDPVYNEKLAEYVFNWDNSYWYNLVPNTPDN